MKKLFLGTCLLAFASQSVMAQTHKAEVVDYIVTSQTGKPEVVVMSVRSIVEGRVRVVLAYNGGKTQEVFLRNTSITDKAQDETTSEYQRIIAKLYEQGYSLKSTVSQDKGAFSTLIFVKDQ
jgi:hypothetical protein